MNIDVQFYYNVCVRPYGELSPLTPEERTESQVLKARTSVDAAFAWVKCLSVELGLEDDEIWEPMTAIVWLNANDLQSLKAYHVFWDEKLKQLVAERRTLQQEEKSA